MWTLLPQPLTSTLTRPSAVTGTIADSGYAYDVDAYPWSTEASSSVSGSSVAGTPDIDTVVYHTFPTLVKAAFSSVTLSVVVDLQVTPDFATGAAGYIISSGWYYEYSTNGGSTWTTKYTGKSYYRIADMVFPMATPATDLAVAGLEDAYGTTLAKSQINVVIPSADFTTGLQNLQVRFRSYTLTSTRVGSPESAVSYKVWDISATVN